MFRTALLSLTCLFSCLVYGQNPESILIRADSLFEAEAFDNAFEAYQEVISFYLEAKNFEQLAETGLKFANLCYTKKEYARGISFLEPIIPMISTHLQNTASLGRVYSFLGYLQTQDFRIGDAIKSYELALNQFQAVDPYSDSAIYTIKEIAGLCTRQLEYDRSLSYLRVAEESNRTGRYLFNIHNLFFLNYYHMGKLDQANAYYASALDLVHRDKDLRQLKTNAFLLFIEQKDLPTAAKILEDLKSYQVDEPTVLLYEARLADATGDSKTADLKFRQTVASLEKGFSQKKRTTAKVLCEIGDYYTATGDLNYAISLYHLALIQVYPDFNNPDPASLPTLDQVEQESWAMSAARQKGRALFARYKRDGHAADLELASQCFELAQAAAEEVRRGYRSEAAAVSLGEYGYDGVEEAIAVEAELYSLDKSNKHLEAIYYWMERSRAAVLTESIERSRNAQLLAIPDSMVVAERELRQALASAGIRSDLNLLDSLQNAYTLLNRTLQVKYPDWERYLSSFKPLALEEVQTQLAQTNAGMLLFFWGKKQVSVLRIDRKKITWLDLGSPDELELLVLSYLNFFSDRNQISNNPDRFSALSYGLFTRLHLDELLQGKESMWIIPDGPLSFLPFETLLSDKADTGGPANWSYLLYKHNIRTGISASTVFQSFPVPEIPGKILAFAPLFKDNARGLTSLPESEAEVRVWQEGKLNTQVGVGTLCNWRNFLDMSSNARIVHLATHARIDSLRMEPEIELADTTLGLAELYQLEYPNSLIILSACESGLGRYQRGEGVMNLNRAFTYNGAAALITGLWTVNDAATAQLMGTFAKSIEAGLPASEALRSAKLDWLNRADLSADRKSPFYWAALVYNGPEFQYLPKKSWPFWYFLIPIGIAILVIIRRFIRTNQAKQTVDNRGSK
ncbi:MAG: CHAT domain-containing protein [Saprospiraceae bacterium]|nr:CHAT domain-containing protein [Saprospiraceae bacterium]